MLHFYIARVLSVIKLKSSTYTAVGNTHLSLIILLNISARPATLKDVSKIQLEVWEIYRLVGMRVVRILTETLGKMIAMHFQKLSALLYFEQVLLKYCRWQ